MKRVRVYLCMVTSILVFLVCGFVTQSMALSKVLLPETYYHLDIGVQLAYSGPDWKGLGYNKGSYLVRDEGVNFASEIELLEAFPLLGREGEFNFYDRSRFTHNIPSDCSFAANYAPYSGNVSVISASSSGRHLSWKYGVSLVSSQELGVVKTVKKYKGIEGGAELAKLEIYRPLGGEALVKSRYSKIHDSISDAIEQALTRNLGNNELTLFFCPVAFKYQKYAEVEDLMADLSAPSSVKLGDEYTLKDASVIDPRLTLIDGVLEKQIGDNWQEMACWNGTGRAGVNTGGELKVKANELGSETYKLTIRTTSGQKASCTKIVNITDGRQINGKAVLEAPKQSYEGHPFNVYDWSEFVVDGESWSCGKAYGEGLASNYYTTPGGQNVKIDYDAIVTYFKRGNYPITLNVSLKDGERLFDTKNVQILKTPFANVNLLGTQKQNRKQTLKIDIATCPGQPIVDYDLKVIDTVTGEVCHIRPENRTHVGECIKSREASLTVKDEYFSELKLDFLTKLPSYSITGKETRKFKYELRVLDEKGDIDIKYGEFDVRPDLPPDVKINVQDSFRRDEGSNFASIVAEDVTVSDGDMFLRCWESANEDINSDFEEYKNLKERLNFKKLAIGTDQKVGWQKEGVGNIKIKLHVKEIWNEETLEEFISEEDYLQGEAETQTQVINVAPRVSLKALETQDIDLVILGGKEEIAKASKQEEKLKTKLIENGLDANITWLDVRKNLAETGDYKRVISKKIKNGRINPLAEGMLTLSDEEYIYTVENDKEKRYWAEYGKAPYHITATDAITGRNVWTFVLYEENCSAFVDGSGNYFCIACKDSGKTKIINRRTGQYIGEIPFLANSSVFTDKECKRLYFAGENGINVYNIESSIAKKISGDEVYLPRILNGKLAFVGKKGQKNFYYGMLDMQTEDLFQRDYPSLDNELSKANVENVQYMRVLPKTLDMNGNAVFATHYKTNSRRNLNAVAWYAVLKTGELKKLLQKMLSDDNRMVDVGGILNEKGEISDFYCADVEYDSASNRRRGNYEIGILDMQGKPHSIYRRSRTAHPEDTPIIFAKKDEKNGEIQLIKAACTLEYNYVSGGKFLARKDNKGEYKESSNASKMSAFLGIADGCMQYDDYILLSARTYGNAYDTKTFETYLNTESIENKIYKRFLRKAYLRDKVPKFLMVMDDENRSIIEKSSVAESKKVNMLNSQNLEELADELILNMEKPVSMLYLKGSGEENYAGISRKLKVEPGYKYEYEYTLYQNAEKAFDLLRVTDKSKISGKVIRRQVIEEQNFSIPYKSGFVKFKGIMLKGGYYGREYSGFGGMASSRSRAADCSLEFNMDMDGYITVELQAKENQRNCSYYVKDNGIHIDGGDELTPNVNKKTYMLKRGKHKLDFSAYCESRGSCYIILKNLEIGYFVEDDSSLEAASKVTNLGNGKFKVKGEFTVPNPCVKKYVGKQNVPTLKAKDMNGRLSYNYIDGAWGHLNYIGDDVYIMGPYTTGGDITIRAGDDEILLLKYRTLGTICPPFGNVNRIYEGVYVLYPGQSITERFKSPTYTAMVEFSAISLKKEQLNFIKSYTLLECVGNVRNNSSMYSDGRELVEVEFIKEGGANLYFYENAGEKTDEVTLELSTKHGNVEARIADFELLGQDKIYKGKKQAVYEDFSNKDTFDWKIVKQGDGKAEIVMAKRQIEELAEDMVYKKGQLVRYKTSYSDYENDPSKKQSWLYIHSPYNDGEHKKAFLIKTIDGKIKKLQGASADTTAKLIEEIEKIEANNTLSDTKKKQLKYEKLAQIASLSKGYILDKAIDRFFIDGKYTVLHWQEDDTTRGKKVGGNPKYDKRSNICDLTFYVEGTGNAPWVKVIRNVPTPVKAGKPFGLEIVLDDIEKDELSLITEVYKKGERIFVNKTDGIKIDKTGMYPVVEIPNVSKKAQNGYYTVVCTVSDETSTGIGKYNFKVVDEKNIKATVMHTQQWNKNRREYNQKLFSKDFDNVIKFAEYSKQKSPRGRFANVFWAGEKFVLNADVIGNAKEVTCQIKDTHYKTKLKKVSGNEEKSKFAGDLWSANMKKDWSGKLKKLIFVFTAFYDDGETKSFESEVIIDDMDSYRKLHRQW